MAYLDDLAAHKQVHIREPVSDSGTTTEDETRPNAPSPVEQSPGKMEEVLNQGMSFSRGLMEMASGQKIGSIGGKQAKLVTLGKKPAR